MNKVFITMDIDWACDQVLEDTCDLIEYYDIPVTLFVTHNTDLLEKIRSNKKITLGIHPNFNPLLENRGCCDYTSVINNMKKLVPEALAVRSHSLTSSTMLTKAFCDCGMQYELNTYLPPQKGNVIFPFKRCENIINVPFIFEDDIYLSENRQGYEGDGYLQSLLEYYLSHEFSMLKVFNFHPIHLYLNTENLNRYESSKKYYHEFNKLKNFCNRKQVGTRDFFHGLIIRAEEMKYEFCSIHDIIEI